MFWNDLTVSKQTSTLVFYNKNGTRNFVNFFFDRLTFSRKNGDIEDFTVFPYMYHI